MMVIRLAVAATMALLPGSVATAAPSNAAVPAPQRPVLEAFWGGTPTADQVPWEMINTISYHFASPNGGHCSNPNARQRADINSLAAVKKTHPDLTVLVSIGGWGAPGFGADAATSATRTAFVASCVAAWLSAFPAGLVDGFDIDWEFPVSGGLPSIGSSPADRANYTSLLAEFRTQLRQYADRTGRRQTAMKLSADIPAGRTQDDGTGVAGAPYDAAHSYDLAAVGRLVDIFNLMTYDLCTGYSKVSCFNAPLVKRQGDPNDQFNNDAGALAYMRAHGVPVAKIVLGVPFYGREFDVTSSVNGGLYQSYTATQTVDYKTLLGPSWAGNPAFQQGWDPVVESPFLWNPTTKVWVSYENPRSVFDRSTFAKSKGMAGMMMWELNGDDAQHSLLTAMSGPWTHS
ncbi:MAG TPA: glycosyl hydrolase family 18 protein [Pseudonocardiaceae bacterium]|jgi:chitinase|nr:glycosyl hydrolase family 18 protein [Pseudonocardiaceae bacterium]